jgi:soluble lytic murein transglycosylase-like protein
VKTNLKLGSEHLVWLKKKYKSWGLAVIHYNGLYSKGAGGYLVMVMEREREYEKLFNEKIR